MTTTTGKKSVPHVPSAERLPPLQDGDRLSRSEFEVRYDLSSERKAELVEGVVHMSPPVLEEHHGAPHLLLATCLGLLVWRTYDKVVDFFVSRDDRFETSILPADRIHRSSVFPGLWIDTDSLLRMDFARGVSTVQAGTVSPEHSAFVENLERSVR